MSTPAILMLCAGALMASAAIFTFTAAKGMQPSQRKVLGFVQAITAAIMLFGGATQAGWLA